MGRLTQNPELRYTNGSNVAVCRFYISVDRRFQKQGEEKQADFFNIVAWRTTAEFCSKYFTKGLRVLVEGSIQNRTWDDNDGKRHYATDIVADNVYFADSKKQDNQYFPEAGKQAMPNNQFGSPEGFSYNGDEDDLPF